MTLLSASDDLRYRTLAVLGGVLERFAYLVSLRDGEGHYRHWGLSRIYGEEVASNALAEVHTQVWLELLRTSLPKLHKELMGLQDSRRVEVIRSLKANRLLACPANHDGGGARHFNSILVALASLSRAKGGTHPAS